MLFDFENDLTGPSKDLNGNPLATPSLYELLTQVQTQAKKGSPESYYLFHTKSVKVKSAPAGVTVAGGVTKGRLAVAVVRGLEAAQ